MKQFTPLYKQSKAEQRKHYTAQRGTWNGVNPVPRIVQSKKLYSRKRVKSNRNTEY